MLSEIFFYIPTFPHGFLAGLQLLTEMLPLPLPISSAHPLSSEEESALINSRKLWSAHLHTLGPNIQNLAKTLGVSTYVPLLQVGSV